MLWRARERRFRTGVGEIGAAAKTVGTAPVCGQVAVSTGGSGEQNCHRKANGYMPAHACFSRDRARTRARNAATGACAHRFQRAATQPPSQSTNSARASEGGGASLRACRRRHRSKRGKRRSHCRCGMASTVDSESLVALPAAGACVPARGDPGRRIWPRNATYSSRDRRSGDAVSAMPRTVGDSAVCRTFQAARMRRKVASRLAAVVGCRFRSVGIASTSARTCTHQAKPVEMPRLCCDTHIKPRPPPLTSTLPPVARRS